MSTTISVTLKQKRFTTSQWQAANPVLADREEGFETDSYGNPIGMKMGDGVTAWNTLPYWFQQAGLAPLSTTITAGTTVTPLVVSYNGSSYLAPKYRLLRSDGSYDWNTKVQWQSGQFTITGNDDGTGHFADSFTFYILP